MINLRKIISVCVLIGLCTGNRISASQYQVGRMDPPNKKPVFHVDIPYPTADKPQSKLWYMDGCWWALLPQSSGPSLWQRTSNGWREHPEVNKALQGVPGRADVWANDKEVTAVGVDVHSLTVFRLEKEKNGNAIKWNATVLAKLAPADANSDIETATIVQDKAGHWWVASDAADKVCVWGSADGKSWTKAYELARGINKDDITTLAVLPQGISVIWSDQNADAVRMRMHQDGQPADQWSETTTIDQGHKTADDHLHAALSPDGTLWLTTKNSVDKVGKPQLILRVRSPRGIWHNFPYAILDSVKLPSRPVVFATADPKVMLSGYTIYNHNNPSLGEIVFGQIDTTQTSILKNVRAVIVPDTAGLSHAIRINDITGSKKPFPKNGPWIILASDKEGRIYETDLKTTLIQKK